MLTASEHLDSSSVQRWVQERLSRTGLNAELRDALENLAQALNEEPAREYPCFLSVVLRTQGRRQEQLQDALLCLSAQTDQDFEVLLVAHDVSDSDLQDLQSAVGNFPKYFSGKVRVLSVTGGGRSAPLVRAIAEAQGEYLAFYDDDDLLTADWVEAFRRGAELAPGQVIRANAAVQENSVEDWANGAKGQRAIGAASAPYPERFSILAHLERSYTPFMTLAFPVTFFRQWGEEIDEELPVCEDWDLLMRAATLVGITEIPELTAIYRRWNDSENSYNAHDEMVWEKAKTRLLEKLDAAPVLLPSNTSTVTAHFIQSEFQERIERLEAERDALLGSTSWRVSAPLRAITRRLRAPRQ